MTNGKESVYLCMRSESLTQTKNDYETYPEKGK